MRPGIDCAFAGSTADFDGAASAGVEWVGEYFGGAGCYHVWTNNDRAALAASKIPYRLPIWVPAQSFNSNPLQEAIEALAAFHACGFKSVFAVDIEENSGYTLAWGESFGKLVTDNGVTLVAYHTGNHPAASTMASWLAFWTGNAPTKLDPRTAQQYRGGTPAYSMNVDFSMAADDFPLEGLANPAVNINNSPAKGIDEAMRFFTNQNTIWGITSSGYRVKVDTPADGSSLTTAWGQSQLYPLSDQELASFPLLPTS